ncbi:MAG: hypothetical protein AAGA54_23370 [Myxococcota bacterium]
MNRSPARLRTLLVPVRPLLRLLSVASLVAAGCDAQRDVAPPALPEAPAATPAPVGKAPAPTPTSVAEEPATPQTNEAQPDIERDPKASAVALQKGREAAGKGDQAAALAAFEAAIRFDPSSGRARCEAGWAAFKLGNGMLARDHLVDGIGRADARTKPACLYNLGRVEEAQGAAALAATHYRQSLALRKNATVQARLDELGEIDGELCERAWSVGLEGARADWTGMAEGPVAMLAPRWSFDAHELVLVQHWGMGEKEHVQLAVRNVERDALQKLGLLTGATPEALKFLEVEFDALEGNTVDVRHRYAYPDWRAFAEHEITGYEEGCEDVDAPSCERVAKRGFRASKRWLHTACSLAEPASVECSESARTRNKAVDDLQTQHDCLAFDCCWGEVVD